jgi:hypothetical protein
MENELTWRDVFDGTKYKAGVHIDYIAEIARKCYYKYMNFNGIIYRLYSDWKNEKEDIIDTELTIFDLTEFQQLTPVKESELNDTIETLKLELGEINFKYDRAVEANAGFVEMNNNHVSNIAKLETENKSLRYIIELWKADKDIRKKLRDANNIIRNYNLEYKDCFNSGWMTHKKYPDDIEARDYFFSQWLPDTDSAVWLEELGDEK